MMPLSLVTQRTEQHESRNEGQQTTVATESDDEWRGLTPSQVGARLNGSLGAGDSSDGAAPKGDKIRGDGFDQPDGSRGLPPKEPPPLGQGKKDIGDPAPLPLGPDDSPVPVPASIGDRVWLDANADGLQTAGEEGVSGVTVRLLDGNNPTTVLGTTTTNGSGLYLFENLSAGSYLVEFVAPAGKAFTAQDQGSDDNADSDANVTTGRTPAFTLATWQAKRDIDAGLTDPIVTVEATDAEASEVGPDTGTFTFTRSGGTSQALTVQFEVGGNAIAATDHVSLPTSVTFPQGQSTTTLTVTPVDDAWDEGTEWVDITLTAASGYQLGDPSFAVVAIADGTPDTGPQLAIVAEPAEAWEDDETPALFTVYRTGALTNSLTVNYTVSGTAQAGTDYVTLSGTVILPADEWSAPIDVTPFDDSLSEANETVIVTLTPSVNYGLSVVNPATAVIRDNDRAVSIAATPATVAETGNGTFTLTRTGNVTDELDVEYTVSGTATPGFDYEELSGVATFAAGQAQTTIAVPIIADTLDEANETVIITLEAGWTYALGTPSAATLTILDDATDNGPTVTIVASDSEADEGTLDLAEFTVIRTGNTNAALEVLYTVGGTALGGEDYAELTGSVWLYPGQSSATIPVTPYSDDYVELNETIVASLSPSLAYQFGLANEATATLLDAPAFNPLPSITFLDATKKNALSTTAQVGCFSERSDIWNARPLPMELSKKRWLCQNGSSPITEQNRLFPAEINELAL